MGYESLSEQRGNLGADCSVAISIGTFSSRDVSATRPSVAAVRSGSDALNAGRALPSSSSSSSVTTVVTVSSHPKKKRSSSADSAENRGGSTDRHEEDLPESLRQLGNCRAWTSVLTHVRKWPHRALVVSGPTGCGKSHGCRALLEHLGKNVVFLDGSDGDGTDDLVSIVKRLRLIRRNSRQQASFLVLDDFESFTDRARRSLSDYLIQSLDDKTLGGVIVTATEFRSSSVSCLKSLEHVRLNCPSIHVVREWMEDRHVWMDSSPQKAVQRRGFPAQFVDECLRTERRPGDLRRVAASLEWRCRMGASMQSLLSKGEHVYTNSFDAARLLLTKRVGWRWWSQHAEDWDIALVQNNYHTFVVSQPRERIPLPVCPDFDAHSSQTPLDVEGGGDDVSVMLVVSRMSEMFAECDAMRTRQFELDHALSDARSSLAAITTQWGVETRAVGALSPPSTRWRVSSVRGDRSEFECLNAV